MRTREEPQERQGRVLSQWVPAPWSIRMNQCSGCLQLKQEVPCAVVLGQLKITGSFIPSTRGTQSEEARWYLLPSQGLG